jgi:hypothetical protein
MRAASDQGAGMINLRQPHKSALRRAGDSVVGDRREELSRQYTGNAAVSSTGG